MSAAVQSFSIREIGNATYGVNLEWISLIRLLCKILQCSRRSHADFGSLLFLGSDTAATLSFIIIIVYYNKH
ncbi:hypothetical protein T02_5407, partial [Trichinella nativa]